MNSRMKCIAIAILILMSGLCQAPAAHGVEPGLFFDSEATMTTDTIEAGTPFSLFLVILDLKTTFLGFEIQINIPESVLTLSPTQYNPLFHDSTLNFSAPPQYKVGIGHCLQPTSKIWLMKQDFLALSVTDEMLFCLSAHDEPSSTLEPLGGHTICDAVATKIPFTSYANWDPTGHYAEGCAVANALSEPPIGTEARSWGALKADY